MKRLFWVGCTGLPYSVGDNAQTLAVKKILDEYFSDYEIVRLSLQDSTNILHMDVNFEDLILLHSGGGFGDLYRDWTLTCQRIIVAFPENRIVQLPVSVKYIDIASFEEDKLFFCDKPNFTLLCRTEKEAELLRNNFNCHVEFFPDFAFYLEPEKQQYTREGILFVLRNDVESLLTTKIEFKLNWLIGKFKRPICYIGRFMRKDFIYAFKCKTQKLTSRITKNYIESKLPTAIVKDVQISDELITDENREKIVLEVLNYYKKFKLVITDRFHALVFAALTNTPVIALPTLITEKTAYPNQTYPKTLYQNFRTRFIDSFKVTVPVKGKITTNIFDLIKQRRSTRVWLKQPVPQKTVLRLLEMGYWAPTAANTQAVNLYPVTDVRQIKRLVKCTSPWFKNANPALIIVISYDTDRAKKCGIPLSDWTERFIWQDTAVCMDTLMLTAESLGLKTCWASVLKIEAEKIKKLLQLPLSDEVACMLLLGYSNQRICLDAVHHGRPIRREKLQYVGY